MWKTDAYSTISQSEAVKFLTILNRTVQKNCFLF